MKKISLLILNFIFVINLSAQDSKVNSINALRNELNSLKKVNEELREEVNRLRFVIIEKEESSKATSKYDNKGEEYRIQLGVQNKSIQALTIPKMLTGSMINKKMVYDITGFQDANDAFLLSQELRKLNLAGSFVTRYVNGVRDYNYRFDPDQTPTSYSPPQHSYYPNEKKSRPSNVSEPDPELVEFKKNPTVTKSKMMIIED